jgi:hypothetical protein
MITRLDEINILLREVNQKKRELLAERRKLIDERRPEAAETSKFWVDLIFEIVVNHPEASRKQIKIELDAKDISPSITSKTFTNCLTVLRRRGWIENRGTKKDPKWHVKDRVETWGYNETHT